MDPWLTVSATVFVALIAGVFALIQVWQSNKAQQLLEEQKSSLTRRESDLAREKAFREKYRQDQILPFLESLDKALIKSYDFLGIPESHIGFVQYVPQIRRYLDKPISEWYDLMESVSDKRMLMLNAIDPSDTNRIVSLLIKLVDASSELMRTRNLIGSKEADLERLRQIHRSYIQTGYRLMAEIRNSVLTTRIEEPTSSIEGHHDSDEVTEGLIESLAISLEKGSIVSIQFGQTDDCCWYAVWEIDTDPEVAHFISAIDKHDLNDFEEAIMSCISELYNHENVVQATLVKRQEVPVDYYCMVSKFTSKKYREQFIDTELPGYRKKYAALWSFYRSPREFTV